MSSTSTLNWVVLAPLLLVAVVIVAVGFYRRWRRYVGFGFMLGYYDEGRIVEGVRVLSRLIESPAGRAGIQKWDRIVGVNDEVLSIKKPGELTAFWGKFSRTLKAGDRVKFNIQRGFDTFEVELVAEVIQGPIPVHLPRARPSPDDVDYHDYHYGMAVCTRTGEWVPTMGLSDSVIKRIFGQ